jgi:hypothetical protein
MKLHQTKSFCITKAFHFNSEKAICKMGDNICKLYFDKGLMSRVYKEVQKFNIIITIIT